MAQNTGSIKASTTIGTASASNLGTFSDARNATNGDSTNSNTTGSIGLSALSGPPDKYTINRFFLAFPLTGGIPNNTYGATIKVSGGSFSTFPGTSIIGVLASKPNLTTSIATGDYRSAIVGFATGQSMQGNVTNVTNTLTTWVTSPSFPTNTFIVTSSGVSYLKSNPILQVALVSTADYTNVSPGLGDYYVTYAYTNASASNYPTLEFYYGIANVRVDDNQAANIRNINDVSDARIYQINGVNV